MWLRKSESKPNGLKEQSIWKEISKTLGGWFALPVACTSFALTAYYEQANGVNKQLSRALELAITPTAVIVGIAAATMALLVQTRLDGSLVKLGRDRLCYRHGFSS